MKVNVELDCTPEEMRRLMGLPDLTPVHDIYVRQLSGRSMGPGATRSGRGDDEELGADGRGGLAMWRQLIEGQSPK